MRSASGALPVRREGGFTLLEIMVVLGILGVLFGTLFTVYSSTLEISAQVDAAEERGRSVKTVLSLLESDLSALYLGEPGGENGRAEYKLRTANPADDLLAEDGTRTLIEFSTTNSLEFSTIFPRAAVARVRYALKSEEEGEESSTLIRRQQRFPGLGSGWTEIELADDVQDLHFVFVDGEGNQAEEWGDDAQEGPAGPALVTAVLVLGTGGGERYSITVPVILSSP